MFDFLFYQTLKIWKFGPNPKLKKFKYIKSSNALWHNKYLKVII